MSALTPLWMPDPQTHQSLALSSFQAFVKTQGFFDGPTYGDLHEWSVARPDVFWSALWDFFQIKGHKGNVIYDDRKKRFQEKRFFPQATLNYAENLLGGPQDQEALVYLCENGHEQRLTFGALRSQVASCAGLFRDYGIKKGDCVAGFMPALPQAVIAALAAASLGAIWSSCSTEFGAESVIDRLGQVKPKILITTEGYKYKGVYHDLREKVTAITQEVTTIENTLVVPFQTSKQVSFGTCFEQSIKNQKRLTPLVFEALPFDHPLFILFSSGTTGKPKCIVHGHGGTLIQHMKEHQLHGNVAPQDRVFYYTTTGWMMWNWLLSALASRATIYFFDGNPAHPSPQRLLDYAAKEKITHLGVSAKFIEAMEKNHVSSENVAPGLSHLKVIFSTGSPLGAPSYHYVYEKIKKDVLLASISGGTDIVSCFLLGNPLLPVYPGQLQCAGLGMDVRVWCDDDTLRPQGKGELVCATPFPSMPVCFWEDPKGERYEKAYFDNPMGLWFHGDFIETTEEGGYVIHGRSDNVLNPGGVRIGTAEIYRQVQKIPDILESIAVGYPYQGDERIVLFVVLRKGISLDKQLQEHIGSTIQKGATARHVPWRIFDVPDVPRTVNGKIVEKAIADMMRGRPSKATLTLANPESLTFFEKIIKENLG